LSDITCRVERRPLPLDAIHTRNRQAFITPE
jgi:hypothetical protein